VCPFLQDFPKYQNVSFKWFRLPDFQEMKPQMRHNISTITNPKPILLNTRNESQTPKKEQNGTSKNSEERHKRNSRQRPEFFS
jgi:hypothetical protein